MSEPVTIFAESDSNFFLHLSALSFHLGKTGVRAGGYLHIRFRLDGIAKNLA